MRAHTRSVSVAALAFAFSCAFAGHARADVETNEERAEHFFHDAEKKFDAGEIAAACALFNDSLTLAPKLGTLLNLALCHEQQGKVATAWNEFHRGAAWAAQIGQHERQEFAHQHAIALERKLSRLSFQLPRAREIGTLEIDGEPLPEMNWYLPIYLDPGEHTIAVSAPGKVRRRIGISVMPGPSAQAVTIAPLEDEPLPAPPPPPSRKKDYRTLKRGFGIGLVGVGAGAMVVGAYYAQDKASSHEDTTLPFVALGVGLGAALSGGLLLFFTAADAPVARLSIAPSLGKNQGGMSAICTF